MNPAKRIFLSVLGYRRYIIIVGAPLCLLPLIFVDTPEAKCAYTVLLMIAYWVFEVLPIPVTSLIPLVTFPMTGILRSEDTCKAYMSDTVMVFLGSCMCATAFEHSNLHSRIALKVLLMIGTSPRRLLVGFMIPTGVISMWIGSGPTTVLMLPLVDAILAELESYEQARDRLSSLGSMDVSVIQMKNMAPDEKEDSPTSEGLEETLKKRRKAFYMATAFTSTIAGNGTITGSAASLIFKSYVEEHLPWYEGLTFASWLEFNLPLVLISMALLWCIFILLYFRKSGSGDDDEKQKALIRDSIQQKYQGLGSMKFQEMTVLLLFSLLLLLWFFRNPEFLLGWGKQLETSLKQQPNFVKDSSAAFLIVLLLFIIPSEPRNLKTSSAILDWKTVHEKVPWGVMIMVGGSIAMAKGVQDSELASWLGQRLTGLQDLNQIVLTLVVCLITMVLTEVSSNTATASILMPVVENMATRIGIHPMSLLVPVTFCCNSSFMLPIATSPNTIIAEEAGIKTSEMAKPGVCIKLISLVIIMVASFSYGNLVFKIETPPYQTTVEQFSSFATTQG